MKKRYIFLALVPIVLSVLLALLPDKSNTYNTERANKHLKAAKYTGVTPDKVLLSSVNKDRFITADDLAEVILNQDPSYLMIDLRDSSQYAKFTLPGALNIPVEKILDKENRALLYTTAYKKVLFSNGTTLSDQTWILLQRAGAENLKVLDGGVNRFYQLYLNPPKPQETDPSEAFENYSFRKAVGKFLGLPNPDEFIPEGEPIYKTPTKIIPKTSSTPKPKVIVPVKKEVEEDEGC